MDQRIGLRRLVLRRIQGILHVDPLAAQHHGADRNALLFLVQVRDHKLSLISPYPARLIVTRQKLDRVVSRQKREPRVVFNRTLGQLTRRFAAQLYVHFIAHVRDRHAEFVFHLADEIDPGMFGAASTRQSQLAARNLDRHGNKVLRAI